MSERRVWIVQCLCPARHCIMATAGEADDVRAATVDILDPLRAAVSEALGFGALNPWCGLCHAKSDTWQYELARTRFRTMEEAKPDLLKSEAEQAVVRRAFGDMPRSD